MRVAYVCADRGVPVFGRKGGSIHVQEVVKSFLETGAEVELFAMSVGGDPPPPMREVPVHRLPRPRSDEPEARARSLLAANDHLRRALDAAAPFDLVYERHALYGYAGMEHARDAGIPGLLEVNAPLIEEQRRYRGLVLEREAREAERRVFEAASTLMGVSEGVADYLRAHRAARGRVVVIPNGVDPARFAPAAPDEAPDARPFTVGFVGSLRPWHGVEDLVEAFGRVKALRRHGRLLIVGDGPMRPKLEEAVSVLRLDRVVELRGAVPPEGVPPLLATMDVAVAPYPPLDDFYFSPLKVFEYMAAGRAIVAASIGQLGRVLTHGATGLLYPPGDVPALAAALACLHRDPGLRHRLGEAARRVAVRDHTWHAVIRRVYELAGRGALRSAG